MQAVMKIGSMEDSVNVRRVAFVGATQGIGRAVARACAERGDTILLLGRDQNDLERSAEDLRVRGASRVETWVWDLAESTNPQERLATCFRTHFRPNIMVISAADFFRQVDLEDDPEAYERTERLLELNFVRTVLFVEAVRKDFLRHGGGTICVFGSVAGDLPRKPAYLYGATKAGLGHYLEGLDLRYRGDGLRVVLIKPGFIRTRMTVDAAPPPFASDPEQVVGPILRAIDRGRPVVYVPAVWGWILAVLRLLPRFVRRRLEF